MRDETPPPSAGDRLRTSWEENAASWTAAVRGGHIPSRRAGTDEAILLACRRSRPRRILDLGCGEGWLARALAADGMDVLGVDASAPLIAQAQAAGGARFEALDYERLIQDGTAAAGPWDVIVCNFALLDDRIAPLLSALRSRLAPLGRVLIQTVHPAMAGDGDPLSGWREETFDSFGVAFPAAMPWYFRTLSDWHAEISEAGLTVARLDEPLHPETGRPLSLILECVSPRQE